MQHVMQFSDDPTLDSTVSSSHKMTALTNEVRRRKASSLADVPGRVSNEVHPTRLELAKAGNPHPKMKNVLRVLQADQTASANPGPLVAAAKKHAALQVAQKLAQPFGGLAQRRHVNADSMLNGTEVGECNAQQRTHGFGIRKYQRYPGRKYEGAFVNGQRHGMGYESFGSGAAYEGMFQNDVRHGKGIVVTADGGRYEGEFQNGEKHGYGTLFSANGRKMSEGQFQQGMRHGSGTIFNKDGSKAYEGEFRHGARHGQGILFNTDGSRYEGQFDNRVKQGRGMMFSADGSLHYEGEFRDDKMHGQGTVFYLNGTKQYEGMLQQGKAHGQGTYRMPDGNQYAGEFQNDEPHGILTYTDAAGSPAIKVADDAYRAQYQRDKGADGGAA